MRIDLLPVMCIIFLTMFLLVVIPTTKTFRGDIEIMGSPETDSVTTVNVTVIKYTPTTKRITTIQH